MAITEKKPLIIRIPGEITPNELPVTASAVGYDFVQGNYLIYATGSDSWVTAPEMKPIYWQSDAPGNIFTTGSIYVSGSITGSNLVLYDPSSRILAPNGALVISSSGGTFITGSLVVSGTRSSLGTEQTSVLFDGDLFVSGGIGLNDYIQLKPVNLLRIPTNTTASYIYTSGSTNDLYFTQYNGPYTNTTRLRWIESALSTGLLHGGVLSTTNGSTTFSITSGSGLIVNYNASTTTDPYPTIQFLSWTAYISQSLTYVSSAQITYIGINSSGGIIQRTTPFDAIDYETSIPIGRVLHQSGSVTNGTITSPHVSYGLPGSHDIFVRAFGPLKLSGHVLAASGSTLGLIKTGGDSYVEGRNYTSNPSSPDLVLSTTDFALTGSKIFREYISGSNPVIDTGIGTAGYTNIDPTKYVDSNGNLQTVAAGQYTIQRVYWFPNSVNRALFVYYGTAVYNSIDVAQASIADEGFVEGANTAGAAIFVAYIIVKSNATDLSNASQAKIIQAPLFRAAGVGGGAAGGGTTTPGGLDTYVQFNDGGSTFGGVAGLTFNKTTNTLSTTNLAVSNIATVSGSVILGDTTSDVVYISGSVTASNGLLINGNLDVSGGVITYGGTSVGGTAVGQVFEDTDTTGGSYGLVIKNAGTSNGKPFISFVQGSTIGSGYAGGILGWTKAPAFDFLEGINIAAAAGYPNIGMRIGSNNIARFNANGLQVTGSVYTQMLNVNGSVTDPTPITIPGVGGTFALKGSAFLDDTVSDGSSYGTVIRSPAGNLGYATLTLIQDNTYAGAVAALKNTPTGTTYGYLGGLNLIAPFGKVINFRLAYPSSVSVGNFNANGLEVTGTLNVSNGAYINAGGMQIAGNINDGGYNGPAIIDDTVTNGSSYGVVIRNQSSNALASAKITLVQDSTFIGDLTGLNNTPGGTTYGLLGGTNISALKTKTINFRAVDISNVANSYSFGKFSSTGLDVTGVVTASLGFSGSLTTLTDGTPYLLAGPNIALTTGSKGEIQITGSIGGSSGQVQFNNSGLFGGATNVSIGGGDLVITENTTPTTPSNGTLKVAVQSIGGREMLTGLGASGRAFNLQPHTGRSKYGIWMINGGSITLTAEGIGAANATGNVTARTPTLTGLASSLRRVGFVTNTTANAPAGWRLGALWFWRGDDTNRGGFHYITRFIPSNATTTLSGRYFVGLNGATTGTAATEPSNWVNIIGMGCNSGSANFSIMHNDGSGAATTIDLGSNFSAVSSSIDVYELALYCPPSGSTVDWRVENFTKNATITGSISTNLPASTQGLNIIGYTETGGAVAVALDLISMYIETEF